MVKLPHVVTFGHVNVPIAVLSSSIPRHPNGALQPSHTVRIMTAFIIGFAIIAPTAVCGVVVIATTERVVPIGRRRFFWASVRMRLGVRKYIPYIQNFTDITHRLQKVVSRYSVAGLKHLFRRFDCSSRFCRE